MSKANEKRKLGKVIKSKRWEGEWTRAGKRGKGCPGPMQGSLPHLQVQDMTVENNKLHKKQQKQQLTRMWANAQPDGRPAEHRWRPLFNAAKFS